MLPATAAAFYYAAGSNTAVLSSTLAGP